MNFIPQFILDQIRGYFFFYIYQGVLSDSENVPQQINLFLQKHCAQLQKERDEEQVDENSMKLAINELLEGRLSYRKAADKYNIKPSTLESRIKKN